MGECQDFMGRLGPQVGRLELFEYWLFNRFRWSNSTHCVAGLGNDKPHIVRKRGYPRGMILVSKIDVTW